MIPAVIGWAIRGSRRRIVQAMLFCLADSEKRCCDQADAQGMQVAEVPDKDTQGDQQLEPVQRGASRGVTATIACLAALLVIGASIATLLPNLDGFSLPSFDRFTPAKLDGFSLFNRAPAPKSSRVAVTSLHEAPKPPRETITVPIPDPAVNAALKEIRSSQEQSAVVLASLTQSSATQQTDLKRISRQLSALTVQVEALAPPLTTSSIPRTTASIPRSHPRARILRASRKTEPPLPPPVGPVSVGGAPLSPAPQSPAPVPAPVSVSSAK
jgi:hypothetical protein